MSRQSTLEPELDDLARRAGSVTKLREVMGDIPWTTLSRWNAKIREGQPLPRAARAAITLAKHNLPPSSGE